MIKGIMQFDTIVEGQTFMPIQFWFLLCLIWIEGKNQFLTHAEKINTVFKM